MRTKLTVPGTRSMLRVDARRMLTSKMFYILLAAALVMPILILVMTSMVSGTTITDPTGGSAEMTMEAFTNTWQIIGSSGGMAMDMTSMMNINLVFFLAGVFVCLFVAEDFRSGYAKNLFTVRARKGNYVASKTIVCFIACALMLVAFFLGAMLGGKIAGLSFDLGDANVFNVVMCLLAKIFLMAVFVAIALLVSVFAKQRTWLSLLLFLFGGMLLFMMIPMMTPLTSGFMNVFMCLAGGILFAAGLGKASAFVLTKQDLV